MDENRGHRLHLMGCGIIKGQYKVSSYAQGVPGTDLALRCISWSLNSLYFSGIILQDLTFVHIGNPDNLSEGCINFSKRWQQFGILDNMKRFKAA